MQKIAMELMSSITTVALAILVIAIFIYYGAGAFFYVIVAIAIFVGFLNAWLISKATPEVVQKAPVKMRTVKRHSTRTRKRAGTKA